MTAKRNLTVVKIAIYCIILFFAWTIRELVVQPIFSIYLSPLANALFGEAIKLLVWTLPAILLIQHFHGNMQFGLKEMFVTKPDWRKAAPFFAILAIPILQAFVFGGGLAIDPTLVPERLIGAVLFVGITEEIVFRGFLLNTFLTRMKTWQAVTLDAILFTLIHYPIWIYNGFQGVDFINPSLSVAALSVIFAFSFIKTKNIFIPILIHMLWNLLLIILYIGGI